MEEEKRKSIEAKLTQLFAQFEQSQDSETPADKESSGIRLIRRRKGTPDKRIA